MKQKLLNNFKLRATLLVAMLCAAFTGAWAETKTDVLNQTWTGITGTSYSSWSGKTSNSDAVYAGNSAGGNSSIQLRSNSNNSGIVTTTSGGKVKSITIEWNSSTQNGRTLNVYGKNSAYSAATDLYNSSNQGDLLGTIVCGTSTSLEVDGDYEYIGFRSASGAMYLDEVQIEWEVGGGDTPTLEDCDLALTGTTDLVFDLYNNADAQVINYTTSSTGAVTVASSEYINAEVSNGTITVTPLKKTSDAVVITVNQAADDNYKAGSTTFTVNITDSTPKTGAWVLTSLADLGQGDVFVIVGNNGSNYAMSNDNGTSSAPTAVEVTIENEEITSDVEDNIKWNISGNATDGYTFYPNGASEKWLYCTNANNGVRVGTNDSKTFVIDSNYLKHSGTSRYVGVYNSSDWRCYTNTTGNIANQTFAFYKYVDNTTPQKANPELSFSSATAEATFGQDFTAPTLNAATGFNGTVEYSSSVETVAQVMDIETGELKIVGGGTTVITATFAGNDDFKAGSASYTLTVTDNRIATTITQENITIDIADIATLTQLTPVVKDANDNFVAYTNSPTAEGLPEVYFETVSDDNGILGSFDSHGNITLNSVVGTATIKAIYNHFQLNSDYRPSECTFTITVESPLNGIAEFCTLESGNTGTVRLTDAVVLYVNGKDMFVRDNTGAIDFYNTGLSYEAGNILNGKINAKYTRYNGMDELTTPISDNTLVATAGSAVTPTEITTSVAADNACNLVKLSGVTVTSSNNKFYVDEVQVYDKFKLNYTIEEGKTYDIVGIMIPYNSIYEICPTEAPVEIEVATPSITITPDTYEMDAKAGGGELPVVCANLATDPQLEVVFVEADGETLANYDWITAEINNNGNIDGQITANTGDARTAYFYVQGVDADNNVVKSNLVTFTQEAAITEPYITVNTGSWDFDANGGSHTFGFDFANLGDNPTFEVAFFDQTGETEIECGWISYEFVDKVTITASNNDENSARTAYFKVYAVVNETKIYSNLVTINQEGYVAPVPATTYSLATSITAGKHYLIVGYNSKTNIYQAMGVQNNNNRAAVDVPVNEGKISVTDEGVKEVVIYGPDASGFYTIYDAETPGCLYAASSSANHMKTQSSNDLNGKWAITFDATSAASVMAQGGNSHNEMKYNSGNSIFSCYASGNTQSPIYLYEKDEDTPAATTESVTLNAYGYTTFATTSALDFLDAEDADYSAWRISEINGSAITFEQLTQHVAAGQGIFIKGTANAAVDLHILPAGGATLNNNLLKGITTATSIADNEYYGLKGNTFVPVNAGTVPAGKALLPASNVSLNVKAYTFIFNDADGIQTIQTVSAEEAQTIFNLAGQRLPKAQKGINIINGKKVLVK